MQFLRSLIFLFYVYGLMAVLGILFAIPAFLSRNLAYFAVHFYTWLVIKGAHILVGISLEIRGKVPSDHVVVASKHQSFFDVIIHSHYMPRATFVMKQELRWAPILGFYAMRIGVAPVDRGKGAEAVEQMMDGVGKNQDANQLVIYPQGTRVPPGTHKPYKIGAGVLAQRTGRPVVLSANNVGLFWPKRGIMKYPGHAIVDYMGPADEGLELQEFVVHLEDKIEARTNELLEEAGFKAG
ncbi:MAG: lysophospholipid acyltransferase family protein [Pseudomonadota bacterium]